LRGVGKCPLDGDGWAALDHQVSSRRG
jgi:hypothetical protein